jgi:hypothetical protein
MKTINQLIKVKRIRPIPLKTVGVFAVCLIFILGLSACKTSKTLSGHAVSKTSGKSIDLDKKLSMAHGQFNPADKLKKSDKKRIAQNILKLRMPFIANEGQMDKEVRFYAKTFGGTAYVTRTGELVYSFSGFDPQNNAGGSASKPEKVTGITLKETLVGASVTKPQVYDQAQTKVNYFIGNDKSKWKTNITTYDSVSLGEIYKGIDLSLKAHGKTLEKIFTVQPGADPGLIRLKMEGANGLKVNDKGELEIETGLGELSFTRPVAWQEKNGKREEIQVAYHLENDIYGFQTSAYDKSLPLIIDPVLIYSTYLGGHENEYGSGIAVDELSNAYVTGYTNSTNFPTTAEAFQSEYKLNWEVFVTKISADGTSLIYSTYLGGTGYDQGTGVAVDDVGNAYVTGFTSSTDFPMVNPYQENNAGSSDVFVAKISGNGDSLVYSTYLGGTNPDYAYGGIALDDEGNAYVMGHTQSENFPTTGTSTYQGEWDIFVAKISSTGFSLNLSYSTYIGGTNNDYGLAIAADGEGNAYVAGHTDSTDFPTTTNSFKPDYAGGSLDGFVAKLSADGTSLIYSTYLGGSTYDYCFGIAVDGEGNAYVTGDTSSVDFPTTANALQIANLGNYDVFITKLSADGTSLIYSTYLGGIAAETGRGIVLDAVGKAYVTGHTNSGNFPLNNPLQTENKGDYDVFVTIISADGSSIIHSTYLGGTDRDWANGIALDVEGNAYVTGETLSSEDFPTKNPYQIINAGIYDVFVAKISELGVIWHVDGNISASGDGTNWGTAFKTIQEAIDDPDVAPGDEIWVAQGTYDISVSLPITVDKAVAIYGGFSGGGWETKRDERDWRTNPTIIDGGNSTRCFNIWDNATIDGFTITKGNYDEGDGGGMSISGAIMPKITNCSFIENRAYNGGAIAVGPYSIPTIMNCIFRGNVASQLGGGIYNMQSSSVITNCIFFENMGEADGGGGIGNINSNPTITNCTFWSNSTSTVGGGDGIHNIYSQPKIVNSIFYQGTGTTNPEIFDDSGSISFVSYSNIEGGFSGVGNINSDPLFADPENGNFHLLAGSPCIDAGDNEAVPSNVTTDFYGKPRFYDDPSTTDTGNGTPPIVDMGADEYVYTAATDTDSDGIPDDWEIAHGLDPNSDDANDDPDNDGLSNLEEYQNNTDPKNPDTDGDCYWDGVEVNEGYDPTDSNSTPPDDDDNCLTNAEEMNMDIDSDGVMNLEDNCKYIPNPTQEDADDDGVGDVCDNCPYTWNPGQEDTDLDHRGDVCDNAPYVWNPGQEDFDNDLIPDVLDNCPQTPNGPGRGTCTEGDNIGVLCATAGNNTAECGSDGYCSMNQEDADLDDKGDACDGDYSYKPSIKSEPPPEDRDGDGIQDSADNCPDDKNADQLDYDGDGVGDACDPDDDDDGVNDDVDNCPFHKNNDQADIDGDGIGDACDPDANGNGIPDECEVLYNPGAPDWDEDGVIDSCDNCQYAANPVQEDSDQNGIGDACEPEVRIEFVFTDLGGNDPYESWLPEDGRKFEITAKLYDIQGYELQPDEPIILNMVYANTSKLLGKYTNDPSPNEDYDYSVEGDETVTITATSHDYGGKTVIAARTIYLGQRVDGELRVPKDSDNDGLPDAFELDTDLNPSGKLDPFSQDSDSDDILDALEDKDGKTAYQDPGDGLTAFEEYRGVMWKGNHHRLSTERKKSVCCWSGF